MSYLTQQQLTITQQKDQLSSRMNQRKRVLPVAPINMQNISFEILDPIRQFQNTHYGQSLISPRYTAAEFSMREPSKLSPRDSFSLSLRLSIDQMQREVYYSPQRLSRYNMKPHHNESILYQRSPNKSQWKQLSPISQPIKVFSPAQNYQPQSSQFSMETYEGYQNFPLQKRIATQQQRFRNIRYYTNKLKESEEQQQSSDYRASQTIDEDFVFLPISQDQQPKSSFNIQSNLQSPYRYFDHPESIRCSFDDQIQHECYELPNKTIKKHPVIFNIHKRQSSQEGGCLQISPQPKINERTFLQISERLKKKDKYQENKSLSLSLMSLKSGTKTLKTKIQNQCNSIIQKLPSSLLVNKNQSPKIPKKVNTLTLFNQKVKASEYEVKLRMKNMNRSPLMNVFQHRKLFPSWIDKKSGEQIKANAGQPILILNQEEIIKENSVLQKPALLPQIEDSFSQDEDLPLEINLVNSPPEDLVSISDKGLQGDFTPLSRQLSVHDQHQRVFDHQEISPIALTRNNQQAFGEHGETFSLVVAPDPGDNEGVDERANFLSLIGQSTPTKVNDFQNNGVTTQDDYIKVSVIRSNKKPVLRLDKKHIQFV